MKGKFDFLVQQFNSNELFPHPQRRGKAIDRSPYDINNSNSYRDFQPQVEIVDMASSSTALLLNPLLYSCGAGRRGGVRCVITPSSSPQPPRRQIIGGRRNCLLFLVLSTAAPLAVLPPQARSEEIPLFGLRKRIKKIEEEAEVIVEEGEKAVEQGIAAAEKEIQAAEEGIVASAGVGVAGDLLQAGAVAGAEAVGVLVGVSVVNGILAPERQKP
ncbi:hypothetical protein GW17_00024058 [Ensete ventricosum]|nr:hypothetical protein GW17_00024058 [Ensete ventricosum]RZR97563.1 hypothetical protein BHM03_00026762 [Ensete ventricosum]